ncbi:metal binding domain of Ada-domain-containing protein [Talaromyces proteolyticus]|uniref:Metal binding domain of Ada-domain-containing protein n=1 Tax=Talaromyces proteolyticus TaxID=1131652 RepID=A0AAD4KWL3_9EURO|nr:metal binding domain of Ada-domain-containing protein [Talaromyces proteolyticus]KAH8702507.1 metal binding domain of Ada-domain-containing protein [Talaromyces proteolyticus]
MARLLLPPTHNHTSPSTRWKAVVYRDASNNSFVYAVRSTRIYCRPNCPARLARRANVEFYDSPAAALAAGYRACKRCKPGQTTLAEAGAAGGNASEGMVAKAKERIASALRAGQQRPTLGMLAKEAGLTPSYFHRVFKKVVGLTPGQFADGIRKGVRDGVVDCEISEGSAALCQEVEAADMWFGFDDLINWDELENIGMESSL